MDNDLPPVSPPRASLEGRDDYESLRFLVKALLVVVLLLALAFTLLLRRQLKNISVDAANYQAQTTNVLAQFKRSEPMADDMFRKFQEFGRTNPDFLPYLAKYGITPGTSLAPGGTNRSVAPAAAPKKK